MTKLIDAEAAKNALRILARSEASYGTIERAMKAIDALPDASEGSQKSEWSRQHIDQWRKGSENEQAQQAGDGAEEK